MFPINQAVDQIDRLFKMANEDNMGDVYIEILNIRQMFHDDLDLLMIENHLSEIRKVVICMPPTAKLFSIPVLPEKEPINDEKLKLISLEFRVNELCYAFHRVEESAGIYGGGSSPTRLYLNSIYFYIYSLFIVDAKKPNHKTMPYGGSAILVLQPLKIDQILEPIMKILGTNLGENETLCTSVQKVRNKFLVHGDFAIDDLEGLVEATKMRDFTNHQFFNSLLWNLFYEVILLDLRLISIFSALEFNHKQIVQEYLDSLKDR